MNKQRLTQVLLLLYGVFLLTQQPALAQPVASEGTDAAQPLAEPATHSLLQEREAPFVPPPVPSNVQAEPSPAQTPPLTTASSGFQVLALEGVSAYTTYIQNVHKRLHDAWDPRRLLGRSGGKTVVRFQVGKQGEILQLEVTESSGSQRVDEAAVQAVQKSAPFFPLPNELAMETLFIQYTFDFYKPF